MTDCIFCKIAAGEIPSTKVYEDGSVLAFRDLDPQAPTHVLIIPKTHIGSAAEITPENSSLVAHIFEVAAKLAADLGVDISKAKVKADYVAALSAVTVTVEDGTGTPDPGTEEQ